MRDIDSRCVLETTDSNIKFEEKGKKIIFKNIDRKLCTKVQVDGCAILEGAKCDKLLKVGKISLSGDESYVELKGIDIKHAADQLRETIKTLHNDTSAVTAYIICSSVKPAARTLIQKEKVRFKNTLKANLVVKESGYEVII